MPTVRDFDFHPDEDTVRVFSEEPAGLLRLDTDAYVSHARYKGHAVLWHYAFADRWYKINITTDVAGNLVETGKADRFAVNCDIATPLRLHNGEPYAVDLFLDVLIRADLRTYQVHDRDEFDEAVRHGLISPNEARHAELGLTELIALVQGGGLRPMLDSVWPIGPADPPPAHPVRRVPPTEAAWVLPTARPTW